MKEPIDLNEEQDKLIDYKMTPEKVKKTFDWFSLCLAIPILYYCVASFVYWIRHPELTQMQVFLDFIKVVTWQ